MIADLQVVAAQSACESIGVIFRTVPTDGRFHLLGVEGKSSRNGAGRIRLYADGEGGQVWNHVTGNTLQFWAKSDQAFTPAEAAARRQRAKEEREKAEALLAEERALAAKVAAGVWKVATPPVAPVYFNNKGVTPTDTMKEISLIELVKMIGYHPAAKGKPFTGGMVQIIPVSNGTGITTIEMIDETGLKAGLKNGLKKGCFWSSHKLSKGDGTGLVIGIGEGVATMLTYFMAGGNIGIAALSCGNLAAVARYFRNRYPAACIEIVSDVGNGEQSALEAARAVDGYIVKPTFPDGSKFSDINDLHTESGLQAVKDCIQAAAMVDPLPPHAPETGTVTETPGDQWPEPLPLPEGLPPVKVIDPAMIPAPFRAWLFDIAHRMQAPIDFPVTAAIVATGSLIGRGCGIYPKRHDNWLVVPNLFGAAVGDPSIMKTPATAEAMKPLIRLEIDAKQQYQAEMETYSIDSEVIEIQKKAICENIKKVVKKNPSADVSTFRDELAKLKYDEPVRRRYQTQDGTVEMIGVLMNQNPRGILTFRDELIGWLHTMDKPGRESDRAFHLEGWNGNGRFTYDRIGRGTLDIEAVCESVFGAITPGPLADYIRQAVKGGAGNDGLMQRLQMLVYPDTTTEWINIDRYPDAEQKNRAFEIFKALSEEIPGAVQEEDESIPALRFTPAGQEIFDAWRHDLETRLRNDRNLHPVMVSHLAKYRSLMPSLALIFHLIEVADRTIEPGPVSEQSAIMAAAWCGYLESHAGRVYSGAMLPGMEAAREIVKHIKQGDIRERCKLKDIYRPQWSRLTTPEDVRAGLDILIEYDWLALEKVTTGGRPSEIIRLNPKINF